MTAWNIKTTNNIEQADGNIDELEATITRQAAEIKFQRKEFDLKLKNISIQYYTANKEMNNKRDDESNLIDLEVEVTKTIRNLTSKKNDKLLEEIKDVK